MKKRLFLRLNREFTDTIKSVVLYKNNNKELKNEKNWFELVFGF
ncbi:hypothetical protein HPHPH28_1015 [Helicobacter pylori Hp H-28]|nr:hypothetical protein HPHPH28_1015 [Helicobacter pylori Hp H-28]